MIQKIALIITISMLYLVSATFAFAQQEARVGEFECPLGEIKNGEQVQKVTVTFDKEVIKNFDYNHKPPQLKSVHLYDAKGDKVQTIKLDIPNYDYAEQWPELVDLNFDGYADLSVVNSRGTLGSFYEFWLYNPQTKLFEYVQLEDGEPINIDLDYKHQQIISSASVRQAYQSNVAILRWEGNRLITADSSSGYFLPVKVDGEMNYCEIITSYNDEKGNIDYSAKIELLANGYIKLHGELPLAEDQYRYDYCYNDAGVVRDLLEYAKVMLWQKNGNELFPQKTLMVTQWVQSKDSQGKLIDEWCPVIPYVDLQKKKVSTFVLDYPSEHTELKLCEPNNPMEKKKAL